MVSGEGGEECQWFSNARTIQTYLQSTVSAQTDGGGVRHAMTHVPVDVRSVEKTVARLHDAVLARISAYFERCGGEDGS